MHYIDTAEQFRELRTELQPAYITSKRYGRIPVPCACTLLVRRALIRANTYNPNTVSKDKMKLLRQSIRDNGFCFPIVTIWDDAESCFVIVDGFHRNLMGMPEWMDLDYVPLVYVAHDISQRMYATVQFNKARGVHQVDLDADVIRSLIEQGNSEDEIATHLGIDLETIHRYKQLTGISELFARAIYSPSWAVVDADPEQAHG
jgi:ParB-like chromosome segregation protein Spo0J